MADRYSLYAPFYDLIVSMFARSRRRAIEQLELQTGERLLILGAGTGNDLPYLPVDADVTAIDLAPGMVAQIRKRAAKLGRDVRAEVMDAERLALPDQSYEAILLSLTLAVLDEPQACLSECARVLVPGGRVVLLDKFQRDRTPIDVRVLNGLSTLAFGDRALDLAPLLVATRLTITHDEAATYARFGYRLLMLTKDFYRQDAKNAKKR